MKGFANTVTAKKTLVLIIIAIALISSIISMGFINVRVDYTNLLPQDAPSSQINTTLAEKFKTDQNAVISIKSSLDDYDNIRALVDEISALEGVSNILWLGTFDEIIDTSQNKISSKTALFNDDALKNLIEPYYKTIHNKGHFEILLNISPDSEDAVLNLVSHYARKHFWGVSLSGSAFDTVPFTTILTNNIWFVLLCAVLLFIGSIIITYKSKISCVAFSLTLLFAIVLNVGTCIFTADISIISLALSILFAMFFTTNFFVHFSQIYCGDNDIKSALAKATPTILKTSLGSGLCLLALFAFSVSLSSNLAISLVKAVVVSAILVIFVLPTLLQFIKKMKWETPVKIKDFSLAGIYHLPFKFRCFSLILAILLAFLGCVFASSVVVDYDISSDDKVTETFLMPKVSDAKQIEVIRAIKEKYPDVSFVGGYYPTLSKLTHDFVMPIYSSDEKIADITISANAFLEYLSIGSNQSLENTLTDEINKVVVKKSPAIIKDEITKFSETNGSPVDILKQVEISRLTIKRLFDEYYAGAIEQIENSTEPISSIFTRLNEHKNTSAEINGVLHTYLSLNIPNTADKNVTDDISALIKQTLGTEAVLYVGDTAKSLDFENLTANDFSVIFILSLALSLVALMIIFREFRHSLVAIFAMLISPLSTLAFSVLGANIGFVAYTVLSAILMSITLGFSLPLMLTLRYSLRDGTPIGIAVEHSIKTATPRILISAILLLLFALLVALTSSNPLCEIMFFIALGVFVGAFSTLFILPSLLAIFKYKSANK